MSPSTPRLLIHKQHSLTLGMHEIRAACLGFGRQGFTAPALNAAQERIWAQTQTSTGGTARQSCITPKCGHAHRSSSQTIHRACKVSCTNSETMPGSRQLHHEIYDFEGVGCRAKPQRRSAVQHSSQRKQNAGTGRWYLVWLQPRHAAGQFSTPCCSAGAAAHQMHPPSFSPSWESPLRHPGAPGG